MGPLNNDLPGVNSPTLVPTGLAGASYSTVATDINGFLGVLSGYIDAKVGTYTIWANTPSSATTYRKYFGRSIYGRW